MIDQEIIAPPDEKRDLYDFLSKKKYYTNSYEEFVQKYSDTKEIDKLYQFLSQKKYYTDNNEDFLNKYFPSSKKTDQIVSGNGL